MTVVVSVVSIVSVVSVVSIVSVVSVVSVTIIITMNHVEVRVDYTAMGVNPFFERFKPFYFLSSF